MILGFKKQFQKKILSKIKIHTMREDPLDRWQAGNKIHAFIHTRTKMMEKIYEDTCKSTQTVLLVLDQRGRLHATVDRRRLNVKEVYCLAINDGFDSVEEMVNWFFPLNSHGIFRIRTMWTGKIIHWTDFKY